jgi:ADP-heptose:LPS heptosyltransferase
MKLIGENSFPAPRRILLIQLRRLGDALLCTPAIRTLATRFPDAKIDFIAEYPASEALMCHPEISRLLVPPMTSGLEFFRFIRLLRRESYDWAIDFMSNPRSAQFARFSGAPVRIGLDRRGRRWAYTHRIHEEVADRDLYAVDLRLKILEQMGVNAAGRNLEIYADQAEPEEIEKVTQLLANVTQPVIAVATGSANPAKRYPADLTAQVIEGLQRQGYCVVLSSGPSEVEFAEDILSYFKKDAPLILSNARVPTLTALYRKSAIYVGPDSGPKHVAVACGIPTVTIFGPGRPSNWNDPLRASSILITTPCDIRPDCIEFECAKRECLRKIQPEEIIKAAIGIITKEKK